MKGLPEILPHPLPWDLAGIIFETESQSDKTVKCSNLKKQMSVRELQEGEPRAWETEQIKFTHG